MTLTTASPVESCAPPFESGVPWFVVPGFEGKATVMTADEDEWIVFLARGGGPVSVL